ncbi:unnamed protein product, partial [Rotaria magnacalcarata]
MHLNAQNGQVTENHPLKWSFFHYSLDRAVAIHVGCTFHFNQAIHRKITHLGLVNGYLRNETVRDQCRQLMALSLIPIDE